MRNIGIVSTGDAEQDEKRLRQAELYYARTDEGLCPNDGAELVWETPYQGKCPYCQFMLGTNRPYGKREETLLM